MDATDVVEFRPTFGRGLTIAVGALCVLGLGLTVWRDPAAGLRVAPPLAAAAVGVWALFGRPAVLVTPGGVEIRNVLRTIELPWPSIQRVETKYALTLYTAYGAYAAWAAPAPSRAQTLNATSVDFERTPGAVYRGVRPGDLTHTASGQAALYIRRTWDALRDEGMLDRPRLERDRPRVHWHTTTIAVVLALGVLSALTLNI